MTAGKKVCQRCKKDFAIEADDTAFYGQVKVPHPTFCPDCRMQRRFAWRNERTLHKRECDLCHKDLIALYPANTSFPVYCKDCWFSDRWDPLEYGMPVDFGKPFLRQFKELLAKSPRLGIWVQQSTNSEYTNQSYENKNCYLCFALRDSEDSAYCARNVQVKQCLDATYTHHSELLHNCLYADKCYRGRALEETDACVESAYLSNARNCQQCFGGINLRSASHIFFGEQLSKEEYAAKLKEIDPGSRKTGEALEKKFEALRSKAIFRFANLINTTNVTGDHLSNARNCSNVFDGFDLENARYSSWVFSSKDIGDCYGMGGSELIYECIGVEEVNNIKFCDVTDGSNNVEYCDLCSASANLFGCIGLRSKEYCILNKAYSKSEYQQIVSKIADHMNSAPYRDAAGREYRYGEFFPAELSPFPYNETIAQENFPLSEKEARAEGYAWSGPDKKMYAVTLSADKVPDSITEVKDSVLQDTIACAHAGSCNEQCTLAFRIIPQELQLYRQLNIPPPTLCPNCRHYARLAKRNPLKLWRRQCQCAGSTSAPRAGTVSGIGDYKNTIVHSHGNGACPNEFETTYAPERPETVYCEACYQQEVE